MNKLTTPLLAAILALAMRLPATAQESSFGLAPSAAPQLQPAAPSNLPLIPDAPQAPEKTDKGDAKPTSDKTAMAEDKLKKQIALRQAQVKAERDPALQALKLQAIAAHTDFEQRKLFLDYYTTLVDRIAKFNPGMTKDEVDVLRSQYTGRYTQTRVAPTIDPATFRTK